MLWIICFAKIHQTSYHSLLLQMCPEGDKAGKVAGFRAALEPLRQTLGKQPFLGGEKPLYHDIIVFSFFMTARSMCPTRLLEADDPVYAWRERMLDAYGGVGRKAVGYPL